MFEFGKIHPIFGVVFLYKMGADLVEGTLSAPEVSKFIESGEKFDVCIVEVFNADAFLVSCMIVERKFKQSKNYVIVNYYRG